MPRSSALLLDWRHQHGVDDMHHAVAGSNIRLGHDGVFADGDEIPSLAKFQISAIDGLDLAILDIGGHGLDGQHVEGQHCFERGRVFTQGLKRFCGDGLERFVGRSKKKIDLKVQIFSKKFS